MPLFEYACRSCDKRFTFLSGVVGDDRAPLCPRCSSSDLRKLISRVRIGRGEEERMDGLAHRLENADFDDVANARRFVREMGRELGGETGEDLSDELEAMLEDEGDESDDASASGVGPSADDGTIY